MTSDLHGKVALVTGASSGIGAAVARQLSLSGTRVFTAQRGMAGYEDIPADLSDADMPAAILGEIATKADRLDILVNNAGIMREGDVTETSLADWEAQIRVNLTAPFLLIRHAIPLMTRSGGGSIVNVGSIEGLASNPGHPAYGASKAGLHGLTRAVAVDHGGAGIRCNAVAPGWIDTPLNEDYIASFDDPERFRARLGGIHPVGRTGTPEDVAEMICWLASDASAFVTGQVMTVDGGRLSRPSLP